LFQLLKQSLRASWYALNKYFVAGMAHQGGTVFLNPFEEILFCIPCLGSLVARGLTIV